MTKRKSIGRAVYVGIVMSLGIIAFLTTPLKAQERGAALSPPLAANKPARVLKGPDANAIYLKLQAGDPGITVVSPKYEYWQKGDVMVRMDGFSTLMSPGEPMLPFQIYQIALPPDADPATLKLDVIRFVEEEMPRVYRVAPAPPHALCQEISPEEQILLESEKWGVGKEIVAGENILVYEKDALYPAENCRVTYAGQLRKWKVATVIFYPLRYNPVKNKLFLAKNIDLKLGFKRDSAYLEKPEVKALLRDRVFDDRVRDVLLNFDHAKPWYQKPLLEGLTEKDNPGDTEGSAPLPDPDYAIITTNETFSHSTAVAEFCFHKENLGFEVIVVTEDQVQSVEGNPTAGYTFALITGLDGYEDVTDAPAPGQRPDKVRKWLQDYYATLGLKYVLLIGNPDPDNAQEGDMVGDMPMKDCQLHLTADVPTDFYFAELSEGNWDLDGDGLAGEYYDHTGDIWGIPTGVTNKGLFCARWEGVLEVDFPVTHTTLTVQAAGGSRYLEVVDSTGFTRSQYIQVGIPSDPETERVRIYAIDGNQLTISQLSNTHAAGTPVETAAGFIRLVFFTEGNTKIWFDEDRNGLTEADVVLPIRAEHRPYKEPYYDTILSNGHYPIKIEYTQSGGDAYCKVYLVRWTDDVERAFKHDDGTGTETYMSGLEADFFNDNDFTDPPIPEEDGHTFPFITSDSYVELRYAAAGDRGPGGVEFMPEVIVGRIPCYDEDPEDGSLDYDKLDAILNKIITYESADVHVNPWRLSILTSCPYVADSDDPDYANDIAKYEWSEMLRDDVAPPPLWDWYRIYEEAYPGLTDPAEVEDGCTQTKMQEAWNDPDDPDDGRGVVMWMTHGRQTSATKVFSNYRCAFLDDGKPSIVFMGACNNGEPEFHPPNGIPLGYENLKKGAIATVSASRSSYG